MSISLAHKNSFQKSYQIESKLKHQTCWVTIYTDQCHQSSLQSDQIKGGRPRDSMTCQNQTSLHVPLLLHLEDNCVSYSYFKLFEPLSL